jgi:hypothetical protein
MITHVLVECMKNASGKINLFMFLGSRVIPYAHVHWKGINVITSGVVNVHPCRHTTFLVSIGHKQIPLWEGPLNHTLYVKQQNVACRECFHFVVCKCLHQMYTCTGKVAGPRRFVIRK